MKNLSLILILVCISNMAFASKKILMMIPNDFMWPEYNEPRKLYEKAGFKVTTAGKFNEKVEPDRRNLKEFPEAKAVQVDFSFDQVKIEDFDAITFVAGNGAWHDFFPNQKVHDLIQDAFKKNKLVGLLCASTGLLGFVGNWDGQGTPIAKNKKVVGYFRVAGILKKLGQVQYLEGGQKEPAVQVDGNLVTGRNPESSVIFGQKIVEILSRKN